MVVSSSATPGALAAIRRRFWTNRPRETNVLRAVPDKECAREPGHLFRSPKGGLGPHDTIPIRPYGLDILECAGHASLVECGHTS
jgi:hypothetical protein